MKLASVKIKNFQSHQETAFALSPGINAFIGESNQGKSATLRSILWAVDNRPGGDAIVSDWARDEKGNITDACSVTVTSTDGGTLRRIKDGARNGYDVNGAKLNAIRTSVPEEVSNFFGLGPVNIQRQLDQPYMLSISPGERARVFNNLIRLEDIDRCLSSIETLRRATVKDMDNQKEAGAKEAAQLKALDWVPSVSERMTKLTQWDEERATTLKHAQGLRLLLEEVRQKATLLPRYSRVQEFETRVSQLKQAQGEASRYSHEYNELTALVRALRVSEQQVREIPKLQALLERGQRLLALLKERSPQEARGILLKGLVTQILDHAAHLQSATDPEIFLGRIRRITKLQEAAKAQRSQVTILKAHISAVKMGRTTVNAATTMLLSLEAQLPTTCPYCGHEMGDHEHG